MEQVSMIGIDLAKNSFQLHGARRDGSVAFRKKLSRGKVLEFLASQPGCIVAMEACGGAHHWGREIERLGHAVRLVPPAYVKAYVKRQKNDAADAEAICEAASRPTMSFVAVKTTEQQARGMLFRTRDLLVRQRTQTINVRYAAIWRSSASLLPRARFMSSAWRRRLEIRIRICRQRSANWPTFCWSRSPVLARRSTALRQKSGQRPGRMARCAG